VRSVGHFAGEPSQLVEHISGQHLASRHFDPRIDIAGNRIAYFGGGITGLETGAADQLFSQPLVPMLRLFLIILVIV
jgi:hypothetical protein